MQNKNLQNWLINEFIKLIPKIFGVVIFAIGCLFLISLFKPIEPSDIIIIRDILPLELVEFSHIGAIIVAILMIMVARGLWERTDSAYYMAIGLFIFGALFASTRALDLPASIIMASLGIVIIPCKSAFIRKSNFMSLGLSKNWLIISIFSLAILVWLGFYIYEKIPYTRDLWGRFSYEASVSRFMRGLLVIAITIAFIGLWRIFSIAKSKPHLPNESELQEISNLIDNSTDSQSNLALMGDKYIYWHENRKALLSYGRFANHWIVMADSIGSPKEIKELTWKFKEKVILEKGKLGFYSVSVAQLPLMLDLGLMPYKIGEEALVNTNDFSLAGKKNYNLRATIKKFEELGAKFIVVSGTDAAIYMERLKQISDEWLVAKGAKEKSFSLGSFDEKYLALTPIAMVMIDGEIMSFANLLQSGDNNIISIDLMRYSQSAPQNIMEYMFLKLIEYTKAQEYKYFSLGLAPLGGLEKNDYAPIWSKIGNLIYSLGSEFYNFEGLRAYKAKFNPEWSPRYFAVSGRETSLLPALIALVRLGNKA